MAIPAGMPQRRSIRLKGYDYSQPGLYFITICIQDRKCLFGNVINGAMILNDAGKMAEKWWYELENKFPDIKCGEMIVMPNHFHCIIHNVGMTVGADPRVCPHYITHAPNAGERPNMGERPNKGQRPNASEHKGSPLHRVVQWYKTMTTNAYIRGVKNTGWQPFNGKLWQRNYYEHIIRNEKSHAAISEYIINNPAKWEKDKFFNK